MPSFQRYGRLSDGMEELSEEDSSSEQCALLAANADSGQAQAEQPPTVSIVTVGAPSLPQATEELGPPKVDMSAPPPYSECNDGHSTIVAIDGPMCNISLSGAGLSGDLAGIEPPSYEEVQRIKAVEAQLESGDHILMPPHTTMADGETSDSSECGRGAQEDLLGTDMLFFLSFAAAFLFNWVGFVVLVCFCHSVAGRSGALAGFGLSLAKWALIMRHSSMLAKEANNWLLWLIMLLGVVISMRAVLQYVTAKREWQRASVATRNRFLLFH